MAVTSCINVLALVSPIPDANQEIANNLQVDGSRGLGDVTQLYERLCDNKRNIKNLFNEGWLVWVTGPSRSTVVSHLKDAITVSEYALKQAGQIAFLASSKIARLKCEVAEAVASKSATRIAKEQADITLAAMTVDKNTQQTACERAEAALQEEKANGERNKKQIQDLEIKVNRMVPELEELRPRVSFLQKAFEETSSQLCAQISKADEAEGQYQNAERQYQKLTAQYQEINQDKRRLTELTDRLQCDVVSHEKNQKDLKQQINTLKIIIVFISAYGFIVNLYCVYFSSKICKE